MLLRKLYKSKFYTIPIQKICKYSETASFSTNTNSFQQYAKSSDTLNVSKLDDSTLPKLTDTFGRHHTYLRISLTERCNLRCKYCMPAEGVPLTLRDKLMSTNEMLYLAKVFVQQGVRKIRLTGGEPTVRKDIIDIISKLKELPNLENVGITTNGLVLTRLLLPMQKAGLDAINISLDTLKTKKYEEITRRKGWERVIAGIDLAIQLGYKPKINCVLMKNFNDDEICDFVDFTKDRNVDIRFIEYMPFDGNKWQTNKMVSFKSTIDIIKNKWPNFKELENGPNDTSKAFKVPGFLGQMGFITSMTEHFCGSCNRLRLTADGNLKVCLFGNKEVSLLDAIRNNISEEDLTALVSSAVKRKKKQHADRQLLTQLSAMYSSKLLNFKLRASEFVNNQIQKQHSIALRSFCSSASKTSTSSILTHVNTDGKARMVDISNKNDTNRTAVARGIVLVGPLISKLIQENNMVKGDVLSVAEISGTMGAKKTSELIPLCHNIFLSMVKVSAKINAKNPNEIVIFATAKCDGKTGVEMEALTAVSIAALTVYDMCKAVSHDIEIKNIRLVSKTGGKHKFESKCFE